MFRRRRTLPPELRDALCAAERAAPRRGRWRRHLSMLLPGALVPSLIILIGYFAFYHQGAPEPVVTNGPASVPAAQAQSGIAPRPAGMPRVIYGNAPPAVPTAAQTGGVFAVRAVVVDGDTVSTGGERLRLNGIDAPEMAQICERDGAAYRCGEQARAALGRILGSGALTCQAIGVDRYDRRVVRCVNEDGQDIAGAMVAAGWAMAYRQYALDYVPHEDEARTRGRGIWAGRFEPPWDWRRRQGY
ncbi:thermonuclease family protein [Roseomonas sp. CAU 1739]|uniref:thermonuclease family protein n=1 Tax=Roseomonas sp. CAU 1739 TaxID=3140364 RepID=UPI00325C17F7